MERTDQPNQQPTPVADDLGATAPELLTRAATDYANGAAIRERLGCNTGQS